MTRDEAIVDAIKKRIDELPINKTRLAKQIGLSYTLLRRTLDGERRLKGDELVQLCEILNLKLEDFSTDK